MIQYSNDSPNHQKLGSVIPWGCDNDEASLEDNRKTQFVDIDE
jgi:hypothetical protein